jgi:maltoporin
LGIWHDQANFLGLGGSNTVAGTYRHGAALVQGTFNARPVREDQGFDLSNAAAWEINNNFLMEPSNKWSMQWAVVLRSEDRGLGRSDKIKWYSTGIRPIYYISDHVNIAFELGYDYVDNEILDRKGGLTKATLALQLARGRGYYNRPVLRLFGTYARWSDAFEGLIGNTPGSAPYGDDTKGWTVGTQIEAWW